MQRVRRAAAASLAAAALAVAVSGCTNTADQPENATTPGQQPSVATTPGTSPETSPGTSATSAGTPGAGSTTTATPTTALLHWTPLPGNPANTITTNGTQTLTVGERGDWWSLDARRTTAPHGLRVMKAGLNGSYAVIVYGNDSETGNDAGTKGQVAIVTTLATGRRSTLGPTSEVPPASDGSWSLFGTTLWYATGGQGKGQPYCLASADLASGHQSVGWCADAHHGFTNIMAADGPTSMMTFDDARPTSCRTLVTVSDSGKEITPLPGVPACLGSQAVTLGAGTVWSIVPNAHRYQQVHVYASAADGAVDGAIDLGLGVNGTLTMCGGAVYWARDAANGTPAALMRWDGSALSVAYQSHGFLGQPLCAGDVLSIADSSDNGTRQLSAKVS